MEYSAGEEPAYVRAWRGRRYVTIRCLDCGKDSYAEEPAQGAASLVSEDDPVFNEDELRAAEEELKRQLDEQGDHRYG